MKSLLKTPALLIYFIFNLIKKRIILRISTRIILITQLVHANSTQTIKCRLLTCAWLGIYSAVAPVYVNVYVEFIRTLIDYSRVCRVNTTTNILKAGAISLNNEANVQKLAFVLAT